MNDEKAAEQLALLAEFEGLNSQALAIKWAEMRDKKDALEAEETFYNKRIELIKTNLLPARMEAENLEVMKVPGVGRVNLRGEVYASIIPGRKDAAYEWLRDNGRGDLITETVNAATLKSVAKAALMAGEPFPDGLFKVQPYTMAVLTKG